MQPQFSLAQLTVLKTPAEISRIAADCGYDYVSMRQIYMGLPGSPISRRIKTDGSEGRLRRYGYQAA